MPYTIGELARAFGLSPDALRYYERLGLLAPSGRSPGGFRLYGEEAFRRLRFIKEAQAAGLKLEDIAWILRAVEEGHPPAATCGRPWPSAWRRCGVGSGSSRPWKRPWPNGWPTPRPTLTLLATARTAASIWTPLTLEHAPGSSLGAWRRTGTASRCPGSTARGASAGWSGWPGWRRRGWATRGGPMTYDLLIVGSGSAGVAAALEASALGAKAAVVEAGVLGGTCVNVGCVPSKYLLRAADAFHRAGHPPSPASARRPWGWTGKPSSRARRA